MTTRKTLREWGEGYLKGEVSRDDMSAFVETFTSGIAAVREEYKTKIEPTIYFNQDTKKLAEKGLAFTSIFDDFEKDCETLEKAIDGEDRAAFEKAYKSILASTDRLTSLKGEVAEIITTISPM